MTRTNAFLFVLSALVVGGCSSTGDETDPDATVDPTPGIDWTVRTASGGRTTYAAGDVLALEATISNIGSENAEPTTLYVFLGTSSRPDAADPRLVAREVGALEAGEEETVFVELPLPEELAPGGHTIWLLVDGGRTRDQLVTENDWARFDFTIAKADATDGCADPDELIEIPDQALRAAIQTAVRRDAKSEVLSCANLAKVRQLNISSKTLSSLEGVQYLTAVFRLSFENVSFHDSERHKFGGMSSVTDLDFKALPQLTSLDFVAKFKGLKTMTLWDTGVRSLAPLAGLNLLESISVDDNEITTTSPLGELPALTFASLRANRIQAIGSLAESTSVTRLYLDDNPLDSLSGLSDMVQLTAVELRGVGLKTLPDLSALVNLKSLNLSRNGLFDIEGLRGLNLEELYLGVNDIGDIGPVGGMGALRKLNVSQNRIADLTPLGGITGLNQLNFRQNRVRNLQPLNHPERFGGSAPFVYADNNCLGSGIVLDPVNNDAVTNLKAWGVGVQYSPFLASGACDQ